MSKVLVLGGCGAVGTVAVQTLAAQDEIAQVVIGDINETRAQEVIANSHPGKVSFTHVNVLDPEAIKAAANGCNAILNCTGPFYRFVPTILRTVIELGINYVDVCDDVDVTKDILAWDADAKAAGITALIGMGSSPGVTNLLAKFAATSLLDEAETIDLYHAHGGEPFEGPGVVGHRFHCMSIPVPVYLNGAMQEVDFFAPEGVALRENVDFHLLGEHKVYPYPHPETITLPRFLPKVSRVTNKGTVLPDEYYDLTMNLCRMGFTSKEPVKVGDVAVTPYDFGIAYILRERENILKATNFGEQRGCVKIVVSGKKDGRSHSFVFSIASTNQALGEGTGIPAAMGTVLLLRGQITEKGILPPEACVEPMDFLMLMQQILGLGEGSGKTSPLTVESIDADGNVEKIEF